MNLTVFISKFSINLECFFVDLNVFRYCSIEVNGNKEKASRIFCQCKRSVYGPVATMMKMTVLNFFRHVLVGGFKRLKETMLYVYTKTFLSLHKYNR